jgi:uncharacterized protein YgbK (DUF1537 family)
LRAIADARGYDLVIGYRGDSTLRGHFPSESNALHAALTGRDELPATIFAPYFSEGGRFTIDDTQYVRVGDSLIPAAQTEFARDPRFAYQHSHLPSWLEARTNRVPADEVVCVSIDDLRRRGPEAVTAKLLSVPEGGIALMNAACDRDVEVFVLGLLDAEAAGRRFLYRTSASFVRVRAGIEPRPLLRGSELRSRGPGLIVVGSYVQRSSEQLALLTAEDGLAVVELDAGAVIGSAADQADEVQRASAGVSRAMATGADVVLHTSRRFVEAAGVETQHIGSRITSALCEVVARLDRRPGFFIIKGGSTAHGIVKAGLGMRRGVVLGQVLPGVPVWQLGPESRFPGLPVVIFPGNVGEAGALAEARRRIRGDTDAGLGL